jgi:hypothetical protein
MLYGEVTSSSGVGSLWGEILSVDGPEVGFWRECAISLPNSHVYRFVVWKSPIAFVGLVTD